MQGIFGRGGSSAWPQLRSWPLVRPTGRSGREPDDDAEAVALAHKHCVACHADMPTHEAFDKPPKGIRLETIEQLRRYAKQIITQVVVERACRSATRPT